MANEKEQLGEKGFKEELLSLLEENELYLNEEISLAEWDSDEWGVEVRFEGRYGDEEIFDDANVMYSHLQEKGLLSIYPPDLQNQIMRDVAKESSNHIFDEENPYTYEMSPYIYREDLNNSIRVVLMDDRDSFYDTVSCSYNSNMWEFGKERADGVVESFRKDFPDIPEYQSELNEKKIEELEKNEYEKPGMDKPEKIEEIDMSEYKEMLEHYQDCPVADDGSVIIHQTYDKGGIVDYTIAYKPGGFDGGQFMYIDTLESIYQPYQSVDDVKNFMSQESYEKFFQVRGEQVPEWTEPESITRPQAVSKSESFMEKLKAKFSPGLPSNEGKPSLAQVSKEARDASSDLAKEMGKDAPVPGQER